jgi:hypothetical protein
MIVELKHARNEKVWVYLSHYESQRKNTNQQQYTDIITVKKFQQVKCLIIYWFFFVKKHNVQYH